MINLEDNVPKITVFCCPENKEKTKKDSTLMLNLGSLPKNITDKDACIFVFKIVLKFIYVHRRTMNQTC